MLQHKAHSAQPTLPKYTGLTLSNSRDKLALGYDNRAVSGTSRPFERKDIIKSEKNTFLTGLDVSTNYIDQVNKQQTSELRHKTELEETGRLRSKSSTKIEQTTLSNLINPGSFAYRVADLIQKTRSKNQPQQRLSIPSLDIKSRLNYISAITDRVTEPEVTKPQSSRLVAEDTKKQKIFLPKMSVQKTPVLRVKEKLSISCVEESMDHHHPVKLIDQKLSGIQKPSGSNSLKSLSNKNQNVSDSSQMDTTKTEDQPKASFEVNKPESQVPSSRFIYKAFTPEPKELANYIAPVCSDRSNRTVEAYAVSTNQGPIRDYNEDRFTLVPDIGKLLANKGESWPPCSYFGVFDGHGGERCADFLRDNLLQYV